MARMYGQRARPPKSVSSVCNRKYVVGSSEGCFLTYRATDIKISRFDLFCITKKNEPPAHSNPGLLCLNCPVFRF